MSKLEASKLYDEIGGEIRPGDTIQIKEFKPPFVLAKVEGIEQPEKGADSGFIKIQLVPMSLNGFPGKMHNGIVRVVNPDSDKLLDLLDKDPPGDGRRLRSVTKFDEQGKQQ